MSAREAEHGVVSGGVAAVDAVVGAEVRGAIVEVLARERLEGSARHHWKGKERHQQVDGQRPDQPCLEQLPRGAMPAIARSQDGNGADHSNGKHEAERRENVEVELLLKGAEIEAAHRQAKGVD